MRKLLFVLFAVAAMTVAGAVADTAATASQTVTISHTGYTPSSVSITTGDAVVFSNKDTVAHTVDFKSTTGMKCSAALPLAIQPGQSASCTFSSAGKFNFSDPANKGKNFRGTVNVAVSPTSSLTVAPKAVVFGGKVTLAGTLTSQLAGQSVQILAQQCGASTSSVLATVTSTTGGKLSYQPQPLKQTAYSVRFKNATSNAVTANVLPRLRLGKVARHRFTLHVSAADSFAGRYATFQRYRRATHRWATVKRVVLQANATGVAPTVVTSAKFRSSLRAGQRVRVVLGQKQVGACYAPGRSNTIRS